MLHKALGGAVVLAAGGFISFLAVAFQGAQSSAGQIGLLTGAAACLALFLGAGVGWLLTREDDLTPPPQPVVATGASVAAAGNITADHGGHVGNVTFNVANVPEPRVGSPELRWADPELAFVPIYANGDTLICNAFLWRVSLENLVEGTVARSVSVQATRSIPPLPVLPVDLHKFHDDVPPFARSHDIRFGDPLILDVIAASDNERADLFLWRSDLPQNYAYVYPLSVSEKEAIIGGGDSLFGLRSQLGLVITLRAVPDPPAKIVERRFRVFLNKRGTADGYFVMEPWEEITLPLQSVPGEGRSRRESDV